MNVMMFIAKGCNKNHDSSVRPPAALQGPNRMELLQEFARPQIQPIWLCQLFPTPENKYLKISTFQRNFMRKT